MSREHPTYLGRVRHVLGSRITVELDHELAGTAPIYQGRLQAVGQIGSLVRIPQSLVDLVGSVSLVGIAELTQQPGTPNGAPSGERWLQIELMGEIDRAVGQFRRGVSSHPALDDSVHFALARDLQLIFPAAGNRHIEIGSLSSASSVSVALEAAKLVTRHGAVVGSTGSGKTTAVAAIVQALTAEEWPASNVIVVDPHGEYGRALADRASIRSVISAQEAERLHVPFWALPAIEILTTFAGSGFGPTATNEFVSSVARARQTFANDCAWLTMEPAAITSDTPVPFNLFDVWHELDFANREVRHAKQDPETAAIASKGDAATLTPTTFEPYGSGSLPPYKSPDHGNLGALPERLRLGLKDPRLAFLLGDMPDPAHDDPLEGAIQDWVGGAKPVSVLDFNGVPPETAELAVGVILELLFEIAVRTPAVGSGIGRPRPVLVVLEEAHRFLGTDAAPHALRAANRIAREGRKYGVGLLMVSQRPSELPDTALSQCGTLIALRLTNGADQSKIRAALPDTLTGLSDVLPSLRTGEAIISGEAITVPTRTRLVLANPLPLAEDPDLDSWRQPATIPDVSTALSQWRGTYESTQEE